MANTLADIRNRVKAKLDTVAGAGGQWGAELDDYISDGRREVVMDLPDCALLYTSNASVKTWTTADESANISSYIMTVELPSDCHRVLYVDHYADSTYGWHTVVLMPSYSVLRAKMDIASDHTPGRQTSFYALQGGLISVGPVTTGAGQVVKMRYVKRMADFASDTEDASVNDEYVCAIEDYAVMRALMQSRNPEWQAWEKRYEGDMAKVYKRLRTEPQPSFVDIPDKK